MIQWSAEELALMREIDAEADRGHLTMDELRESYNRDREARHSDSKSAKYQREYYQANKEKIAEWKRKYRQAKRKAGSSRASAIVDFFILISFPCG